MVSGLVPRLLAWRRRTNLTGRAAILALVVGVLAMSLAYPAREFLAQRSRISALREKTAAQEIQVAALEGQRERWKDPDYVAAQARERLNFVRPGETKYIVLGPDDAPAPSAASLPPGETTWYGRLWESVRVADAPAQPSGRG